MNSEQFLLENIKEFVNQAEKASKDNSYNSAVNIKQRFSNLSAKL